MKKIIGFSFLNTWNTKAKKVLSEDFQDLGLSKFIPDELDTETCLENKQSAWKMQSEVYKKNATIIIQDWVEETRVVMEKWCEELNLNDYNFVCQKGSLEEFIAQLIKIYDPSFKYSFDVENAIKGDDFKHQRPENLVADRWRNSSSNYSDSRAK